MVENIKGLQKELDKVMRDLYKVDPLFSRVKKRNMIKRAAGNMRNDMISKAPKGETLDLASNIGFKTFRNNDAVFLGALAKSRKGGKDVRNTVFISRFIEYGFDHIAWPVRYEKKTSNVYGPGRVEPVKARPFIRPAIDANSEGWGQSMVNEAKATLKKAEKRMKKLKLKS